MKKKSVPATPQATVPVLNEDALPPIERQTVVCVTTNVRAAGTPEAECGPCAVWSSHNSKLLLPHRVLGFAATHAAANVNGWFFKTDNVQRVFVLSDTLLPGGSYEEAALWATNLFPTYTESLQACHAVRWLPILREGIRDLPQLVAREWALASRDNANLEPLFLLWQPTLRGTRELLATEEMGRQIGEAIFGFAATLPARNRG